jgi:ABC-type Fe3+/spermidine/putrescine transport system ATPase subunit
VDASAANPSAVELRGVSKQFAGRIILDSVHLAIGKGEIFSLVGASGSGKSTLLKMVSGIDTPDQGEVWLAGANVTALPPYRRAVHTVFQNYALFPHLDVAGNVGFPLSIARAPRSEIDKRVTQALSWVKLDAFAARRVDTLSGGERQRVALARALVDEPNCVLLDEPLSALDPHLRAATLELLQEIQAKLNVTYLYITHDREEALRVSDRIGVLNRGHLEQIGTPEEVYRSPRTPYVASFLGRINWFEGELQSGGGNMSVRLESGQSVPLDGQVCPAGAGGVRLGVRPEDVLLGDSGFFPARVVTRQFSGAAVALKLLTERGVPVAVELDADGHTPAVGASVHVSWLPRAAHVFAGNAAEASS